MKDLRRIERQLTFLEMRLSQGIHRGTLRETQKIWPALLRLTQGPTNPQSGFALFQKFQRVNRLFKREREKLEFQLKHCGSGKDLRAHTFYLTNR